MAEGETLRKITKALKISLSTAFYWRHNVLSSLCNIDIEQLTGIVESDVTFFIESFKGKRNIMHRKSKKRGTPAKKRSISHEQVCVVVAMDRNSHMVSRYAGMWRVSANQIDLVIGGHIANDVTLCTDSAKNYVNFASST